MAIREIDRISDLPDGVLENILSFLRTKEAVQTSAISKRWKNLWAYSARIDLEIEDFDSYEKFKEFGDMVLSRHGTSYLHMLSIISRYKLRTFNPSDLKRWISLAIKFQLRVFTLKGCVPNCDFLECTFNCASIEDMCLDIYQKRHPGWYSSSDYPKIVPSSVNLPHLKRLHLKHAYLSEEDASRLFAGCPVLKDLTLKKCCGTFCPIFRQQLISLYIVNSVKYKNLVISDTQPKIMNLPCIRRLHITNASMSEEGVARLLTGCPLLDNLSLEKCHGNFSTLFIRKLSYLTLHDCKLMYGDNVLWEIHHVILTMVLSSDIVDLLEVFFMCTWHPIHIKFIWNPPKGIVQDFGSNFDPSIIFYSAECLKLCFADTKVDLKKQLRRIKAFNNLKSLSIVLADWCMHPYEIDPVVWFLHNSPLIEELTLYNPKRTPELSKRGKPKPVVLCNESAYYNSLSIELSEFKNLKRVEIKFCSDLFRDHSFKKALLTKMEALVNAEVVISEYDDILERF